MYPLTSQCQKSVHFIKAKVVALIVTLMPLAFHYSQRLGKYLPEFFSIDERISEKILPQSQFGFRPNRGTCEAIFCIRQLQEKCREQSQPLFLCFIDLEKAFDRVPREALWLVLQKLGCTEKFVRMLRLLHDNMICCVSARGMQSDFFSVSCEVKQGCVLAPTLFALYFSTVVSDALKNMAYAFDTVQMEYFLIWPDLGQRKESLLILSPKSYTLTTCVLWPILREAYRT